MPLAMATVHLTRHLHALFPQFAGKEVVVEGHSAAAVVRALDGLAPGLGFYICDEVGRLRPHVNIFVAKQALKDRKALTDPVQPHDEVHILQALSGG